jgi:hypothetical protein
MIQIKDVVIPAKGTGRFLEVKALNFPISPTNGIQLFWAIYKQDAQDSDTNNMVLSGNLHYPQDQYLDWGTDDSVVTAWVCEQLGFIKLYKK